MCVKTCLWSEFENKQSPGNGLQQNLLNKCIAFVLSVKMVVLFGIVMTRKFHFAFR